VSILVPVALIGWVPVAMLLFYVLRPQRAAVVAYLGAWMFLPVAGYSIAGLPDYTKATAASLGVLLGTLAFAPDRLIGLRPHWLDLPMLIWCLCPCASSLDNGLGMYDGLSSALAQVITWGLPYLIGRAHLRSLDDLRDLVVMLFVGGLVYAPLCLFEVRMSPQLNQWVYGFGGRGIDYASELGKWGSRPCVFMGGHLTLGMFMTAASLCGFWLWLTGSVTRLRGHSVGTLLAILVITTLFCKNMGALSVLLAGILCLVCVRYRRSSLVVWMLIAASPAYMVFRGSGEWGGAAIAEIAGSIHERRGESFQTRLDNEGRLVVKAMQRPILGWGGWGRSRVYSDEGQDITLSDGLWVIALGASGLVGLVAITASLLVPAIAFAWRYPARTWLHPAVAPGGALAVLMALYAIDCLFNAMLNPIYLLVGGGLVSAAIGRVPVPVPPALARTRSRPISVASGL
jgi:hypothetical protein